MKNRRIIQILFILLSLTLLPLHNSLFYIRNYEFYANENPTALDFMELPRNEISVAPSDEEYDDHKDIVVLTDRNFTDFVDNNRYVMVMFYAPWCRHSKKLAPEYAAAAMELKAKGEEVVLAKVDRDKEIELAKEYKVFAIPILHFFVDGEHVPYHEQRTKDAIVTWIKKITGPGVYSILRRTPRMYRLLQM